MSKRIYWIVFILALNACTRAAEQSTEGKTIRDSAGESIVEHSAAYMTALPEWTIDSTPLQMLSGDSTDTQFTRILDAVQRADGGFYIADQQQRDIKSFSANGNFERVISTAGRGPGEVGYVSRLQLLAGDSLAFVDANNRRLSVFAPDGRFARQVLFPRFEDGSSVRVSMQLSEGRLWARYADRGWRHPRTAIRYIARYSRSWHLATHLLQPRGPRHRLGRRRPSWIRSPWYRIWKDIVPTHHGGRGNARR